jgi:hypothetical protein
MRFTGLVAAFCAACGSRSELLPVDELGSSHASPDASLAADASCTWGFAPLVPYTAGPAPAAITIADLDGDGHPDLAVNNYADGPGGLTLNTLRNIGNGTFAPWQQYVSTVSFSVAAGPFLSGSSVDLLVGCDLFPNDGSGVFGNPVAYGRPDECGFQDSYNNLVVADFDGDGRSDFGWTLLLPSGLFVYLDRGGGSFDEVDTTLHDVTPYMDTMASADFDRDGRPDLAGVSWGYGYPSYIRLFHNTGDGTFGETDIAAGNGGLNVIAAGDLNGDGWPDLVMDHTTFGMEVLLNLGDGTFGAPARYAFVDDVRSIAIGDLDGDGANDVVFGGYGGARLGVFFNRGDGTFPPAVDWPVTNKPWGVALGDLNGDRHLDVAVAVNGASGTNAVDVFLSQCR